MRGDMKKQVERKRGKEGRMIARPPMTMEL
jgi:hypothetical protein